MLRLFKQIIHAKTLSRVSILGVVATSLLLTGCVGVQTNVGFFGNGQWSGVQAVTLSPEFVELMDSEGSEMTAETAGLDEWKQQAQDAAADENINVTFTEETGEDGSRTYFIQAEGNQYDVLNEVLFEGKADISVNEVEGQRQITIRFDPSETSEGQALQAEEAMSAEMMEALGSKFITRITGGEIISHNADRVEGSTAFWETPGPIEITLTEAALFDPGTLAPQEMELGGSGQPLTTILEGLEQSAESTPTEGVEEVPEAPQETAPAEAPANEDQALPTSGAILPTNSSAVSLVLAGLVLIALVGAGVATAAANRE